MSSKYRDREGHPKVPYKYPVWVTEGRAPPPSIQEELERAKRLVGRAMRPTHTCVPPNNC